MKLPKFPAISDKVPDIWRDLGDEEEVIGGMKLFCADLKGGLEDRFLNTVGTSLFQIYRLASTSKPEMS